MIGTIIPVILAGGAGKRLWPLSSEKKPKQFLKLDRNSNQTLLQLTACRAMKVSRPENIITITSKDYSEEVLRQLNNLDEKLKTNILLEPIAKNTAAAIAIAALYARCNFINPILWIMPADHTIENPESLISAVKSNVNLVYEGKIITFGIKPTRPEKGYGYMLSGDKITEAVYEVKDFIEKPEEKIAEQLIGQGSCYWNSGMFYVSAEVVLSQIKEKNNQFYEIVYQADKSKNKTPKGSLYSEEIYEKIEPISIDKMIMEKNKNLLVCPVDIGWSDVGSWQSLWEASQNEGDEKESPLNKFLNKLKKAA